MDDDAIFSKIIDTSESILHLLKNRRYDELDLLIQNRYAFIIELTNCQIPKDKLCYYLTEIQKFDAIFSQHANEERNNIKKALSGVNKVREYLNV